MKSEGAAAIGLGEGALYAEPSLADVVVMLWARRLWVGGGAVVGAALAFLTILLCVPRYHAEMLVSPAAQIVRAGSAALAGEYDYAVLPYVAKPMDQSASADFVRFEKIVTGRAVAEILFRSAKIREGVARDRRFRFEGGAGVASPAALADYLARTVRVDPVGATDLRRISYEHPEPGFAEFLLASLHAAADGTIRDQARRQAAERRDYLETAMASNPNPDHRRALTTLLMREEEVAMMIAMDQPYAAALAEAPAASARPVWPRRALFFPVFVLVGAILGAAVGRARNVLDNSMDMACRN